MYEPCVLNKELRFSCDVCGDLPIEGKRWCCNVCEDFDVCDSCHRASQSKRDRGGAAAGADDVGAHSSDHPMQSFDSDVRYEPVHSGNLKDVMANAIERWFIDTLRNAKNGDVNQAALLAEMLATGYGCNKDAEEARYWKQVARNGGARRLEGVYDRLP